MSFLAKHQSNKKQQSNEKKLKTVFVKGHDETLFLLNIYILDSKGKKGELKRTL